MSNRTTSSEGAVLYGAAVIAKYMQITRRQAYHMIEAGGLPTFKIGRMVCARPATISTWVAEQEAAGLAARKEQ